MSTQLEEGSDNGIRIVARLGTRRDSRRVEAARLFSRPTWYSLLSKALLGAAIACSLMSCERGAVPQVLAGFESGEPDVPEVSEIEPSVPEKPREILAKPPSPDVGELDTSCSVAEECSVRSVAGCCGRFPRCVNRESPLPAEDCEEGEASTCGVADITHCGCVAGTCRSFQGELLLNLEI